MYNVAEKMDTKETEKPVTNIQTEGNKYPICPVMAEESNSSNHDSLK